MALSAVFPLLPLFWPLLLLQVMNGGALQFAWSGSQTLNRRWRALIRPRPLAGCWELVNKDCCRFGASGEWGMIADRAYTVLWRPPARSAASMA